MRTILTPALLLGLATLTGCAANGPSGLRIHEALLYGGAQERVVWVYGSLSGGQSSLKLDGQTVELRAQSDASAVPGSLSVNSAATYRTPTRRIAQQLAVARVGAGLFNVTRLDPAVQAVYFTDGTTWRKLNGVNGTVNSVPVRGLEGAGELTDDEAASLGRALGNQGPLAVAVLDTVLLPDGAVSAEPAPLERKRTALYVLPNVPTSSTLNPVPTPTPPATGATVTFTELASGTNATITAAGVQVARTQTEAAALYRAAFGNQSSPPAAPALNGRLLVGVFLGQRSTGGYSVRVRSAAVSGGVLTLRVQVTAPGPGSITTQAITSPWTIVSVAGAFTAVQVLDQDGRPLQGGGVGSDR